MFIPKWLLNKMMKEAADHERRIKRLEETLYQNSKNTITSLQSRKAGVGTFLAIEEIIDEASK